METEAKVKATPREWVAGSIAGAVLGLAIFGVANLIWPTSGAVAADYLAGPGAVAYSESAYSDAYLPDDAAAILIAALDSELPDAAASTGALPDAATQTGALSDVVDLTGLAADAADDAQRNPEPEPELNWFEALAPYGRDWVCTWEHWFIQAGPEEHTNNQIVGFNQREFELYWLGMQRRSTGMRATEAVCVNSIGEEVVFPWRNLPRTPLHG